MISEADIISGCIKGDRASQKRLYQLYAPKMLGVCRRFFEDDGEAEDALQEGFIKVFEHLKTYRKQGSFEGWIRRIMVNTSLNVYRNNFKNYFHEDIEDVEDEIAYDANITGSFSTAILLKMIDSLPSGYRVVFNLYEIEGYSHNDIAKMLDLSVNTSKSQLIKAKRFLRKKIIEFGINEI
ncbi:MAG: sigma-70 family RNA polymerase sigma factor [Bacteroidota bacterium]